MDLLLHPITPGSPTPLTQVRRTCTLFLQVHMVAFQGSFLCLRLQREETQKATLANNDLDD